MKNVAVFFGGKSAESEISVITALQVLNNIDETKYCVYPIYMTKDNDWVLPKDAKSVETYTKNKVVGEVLVKGFDNKYLIKKSKLGYKKLAKIDVVINCCHGLYGEDGTLAGIFEMSGIPYTSSSVLASAITMDKVIMKDIFASNNLPITNYIWFDKDEYVKDDKSIIKNIVQEIDFPLIVKPSRLGSSIGIGYCKNEAELMSAIDVAICYDNKIIVEKAVENLREFNCAILGTTKNWEFSVIEEPEVDSMLSFDDKYQSHNKLTAQRKINVSLTKELRNQIHNLSQKVWQITKTSGVVRIDFLYDEKNNQLYVNEPNTIPGSLSFYLFKDKGYTTFQLIDKLIEIAFNQHIIDKNTTYDYQSSVLKNYKQNENVSIKK